MKDNQGGKINRKQYNPGKIALFGAGATALAVFNMMTNGAEAPSRGAWSWNTPHSPAACSRCWVD
jgi:hypothetical protein